MIFFRLIKFFAFLKRNLKNFSSISSGFWSLKLCRFALKTEIETNIFVRTQNGNENMRNDKILNEVVWMWPEFSQYKIFTSFSTKTLSLQAKQNASSKHPDKPRVLKEILFLAWNLKIFSLSFDLWRQFPVNV